MRRAQRAYQRHRYLGNGFRVIPQRIRVVAALAITFGCGAVQVSAGLSGSSPLVSNETPVTVPLWSRESIRRPTPPPTTTAAPVVSTTTVQQPTLSELVDRYFEPSDRAWALRVAFCESSAQPGDISSVAHHSGSGASGWFQHLPKFWVERSTAAGVAGVDIMEPETNVLVASWLLYETPQKKGHWNESKHCWG